MSSSSTPKGEEELAELLRCLPPAPAGWVAAAQAMPAARRSLDDLVERAEADARYRAEVLESLETALSRAGHEPNRQLLAALRARLNPEP